MNAIVVLEIYCENTDCCVRQCEIFTKDYGDTPRPESWNCPGCGKKAKVHWQRDRERHHAIKLQQAIGTVNAELYMRDDPSPLRSVPLNLYGLEKLPDSWKWTEP